MNVSNAKVAGIWRTPSIAGFADNRGDSFCPLHFLSGFPILSTQYVSLATVFSFGFGGWRDGKNRGVYKVKRIITHNS